MLSRLAKDGRFLLSVPAEAELEVAVKDHPEGAAAERTSFLHQALHIILIGMA
jgi:hypothetical protein